MGVGPPPKVAVNGAVVVLFVLRVKLGGNGAAVNIAGWFAQVREMELADRRDRTLLGMGAMLSPALVHELDWMDSVMALVR